MHIVLNFTYFNYPFTDTILDTIQTSNLSDQSPSIICSNLNTVHFDRVILDNIYSICQLPSIFLDYNLDIALFSQFAISILDNNLHTTYLSHQFVNFPISYMLICQCLL